MKRRRTLLLSITIVLALCAACGWWLHRERQHYALNRQLIDALVHDDANEALALVNAGADPNTRYAPPPAPTFPLLLNQFLHHTPPTVNDSPTAFLMACGINWLPDLSPYEVWYLQKKRAPLIGKLPLLQAMVAHGANVKAKTKENRTALHMALDQQCDAVAEWLLQQGADVNVQDTDGRAPLSMAVGNKKSNIAHLLLSLGANPNAQDVDGRTALWVAVAMRNTLSGISDLLAHGANPNLARKTGYTPLHLAQIMRRHDLIRLLKQHGAK
jgi:ankyrin repeat protein